MPDDLKLMTPKAYAGAPKPKHVAAPKPEAPVVFHKRGDDALNCQHFRHYRACDECHPHERPVQFTGYRFTPWSDEQMREYIAGLLPVPRG